VLDLYSKGPREVPGYYRRRRNSSKVGYDDSVSEAEACLTNELKQMIAASLRLGENNGIYLLLPSQLHGID
jgi:hypothetical protein